MSSVQKPTVVRRLLRKQNTWSPDSHREATWLRKKNSFNRLDRSHESLTDDDVDELRACFELGFGFDSTVADPKLNRAFPALEFYNAVNKQYSNSLSRSSSMTTVSSDTNTASPVESPRSCSFFGPGEEPDVLKTRLKQWAQVVACLANHQPPRQLNVDLDD